jgi:heptosyltransferase-1
MMRILLVKTSSLGDVVHNLPVVADIRAAFGADVAIDWVAERSFAAVPTLHPQVRSVIACEIRRWRRSWRSREVHAEWRSFVHRLRSETYDAIVDTQGLLKSAIVARIARGLRYGLDWRSSREPLRFFYDRVFDVPWDAHAVERNRRLCALALGYRVEGPPVYGILANRLDAPSLPRGQYVVLLHATSHPSKLWAEREWIALGSRLAACGCVALFPWGSADEHERAQRLAAALPGAVVLPRLGLDQLACVMAGSVAVVGVDTGLTHLAAALGVPVVGVYGATDPGATGVYAAGPVLNVGARSRFPSVEEVVAALSKLGVGMGRLDQARTT